MNNNIPQLSEQDISEGLMHAANSSRHRYPKLLHEPGDEFNRVFNFIISDSYMQPHLHPGQEKIEYIYLVKGKAAVLYFDNQGAVIECNLLDKGRKSCVKVPAFTWHTYVMLSECVVTYETMMGRYDPCTWKKFASWAPEENSVDSAIYLNSLKDEAMNLICA